MECQGALFGENKTFRDGEFFMGIMTALLSGYMSGYSCRITSLCA